MRTAMDIPMIYTSRLIFAGVWYDQLPLNYAGSQRDDIVRTRKRTTYRVAEINEDIIQREDRVNETNQGRETRRKKQEEKISGLSGDRTIAGMVLGGISVAHAHGGIAQTLVNLVGHAPERLIPEVNS